MDSPATDSLATDNPTTDSLAMDSPATETLAMDTPATDTATKVAAIDSVEGVQKSWSIHQS